MNKVGKQIISISLSLFILVMVFYGSYLPFKKSQVFIQSTDMLPGGRKVEDVNDFLNIISEHLKIKSPFGQEELIKQAINSLIPFFIQNNDIKLIKSIMDYIYIYLNPILEKGRGSGFNKLLDLSGRLNLIVYQKTQDEKYLKEAEKIFNISYQLGPKRPQALYGLFDVCQIQKDEECIKKIGGEILIYWNDQEIKTIIDSLDKN